MNTAVDGMKLPTEAPSRMKSRATLILILVLFATPFTLASLLNWVDWRPDGTTNNGELLEPARPLPQIAGTLLSEDFLRGKWTLMLVTDGECGQACLDQLYRMRQVRLAQGKNIDRLQRLLIVTGANETSTQSVAQHYPGLAITQVPAQHTSELAGTLRTGDAVAPLTGEQIYLVDPLGNAMMMYNNEVPMKGMVKDLERLLKYSGLG